MLTGQFAVARLARGEDHNNTLVLRQVLIRLHDRFGEIMPDVEYEIDLAGERRSGRSDSHGLLALGLTDGPQTCVVRWGPGQLAPGPARSFHYQVELFLDPLDLLDEENVSRHLENLGYDRARHPAHNLRDFQAHHGLEPTGELDGATRDKLEAICGEYREEASDGDPSEIPDASEDDHRT